MFKKKVEDKIQNAKGLIKCFDDPRELVEEVFKLLVEDFQKAGLVLLPAGNTFENEIYPLVNKHFEDRKHLINEKLELTNVDERITDDLELLFGNSVSKKLSNLRDNFHPIDVKKFEAFDKFIKKSGGPRAIYFGLGPDPSRAHVAYIGEEYINSTTAVVNLSPAEEAKSGIKQAITIGTDIFLCENLEKIIVVATGQNKAESLYAAFEDPDTGLGYLLENHPQKLMLICDFAAGTLLKSQ